MTRILALTAGLPPALLMLRPSTRLLQPTQARTFTFSRPAPRPPVLATAALGLRRPASIAPLMPMLIILWFDFLQNKIYLRLWVAVAFLSPYAATRGQRQLIPQEPFVRHVRLYVTYYLCEESNLVR